MGVLIIMGIGIFAGCGGKTDAKIREDYLAFMHTKGANY